MGRKVKYDYAFKLECVELVLKKHHSIKSVSSLKNVNKSDILEWVSFYKIYGKAGLVSQKNKSYTPEFKLKVLKALDKESLSLREVSLKFNIVDKSTIMR